MISLRVSICSVISKTVLLLKVMIRVCGFALLCSPVEGAERLDWLADVVKEARSSRENVPFSDRTYETILDIWSSPLDRVARNGEKLAENGTPFVRFEIFSGYGTRYNVFSVYKVDGVEHENYTFEINGKAGTSYQAVFYYIGVPKDSFSVISSLLSWMDYPDQKGFFSDIEYSRGDPPTMLLITMNKAGRETYAFFPTINTLNGLSMGDVDRGESKESVFRRWLVGQVFAFLQFSGASNSPADFFPAFPQQTGVE